MTRTMSLAGTTLELVERGHGRPLLFLHPGEGLAPEKPWLELLSRRYRVIAPWHPGFGNSPLIDGSGSVDDVAYLYLDLAAELKLENAVLVGACFGGWIAAEMMVRSTPTFPGCSAFCSEPTRRGHWSGNPAWRRPAYTVLSARAVNRGLV